MNKAQTFLKTEDDKNRLEDVEYEEYDENTLMIDRSKHYSDFLFVIILTILVVFAGFAGALSPEKVIQMSSSRILHNDLWKSPFVIEINDISSYNNYLTADLQFFSFNYNDEIKTHVSINITINYYLEDQIIKTQRKTIKFIPKYQSSHSKLSKAIRLFMNQVIDFDKVQYSIEYADMPKEIKYILTSYYMDDSSFSVVILIFRILFSFLSFIFLIMFLGSIKKRYFEWRIEQKATLLLLIFSIANNNPLFFYINLQSSSIIFVIINHGSTAAFYSYLSIYILIIIDTINPKQNFKAKKNMYIYGFVILFFVSFFHRTNNEIFQYSYSSNIDSPYNIFLIFEMIVQGVYIIIFFLSIVDVLLDVPEKFLRKVMIYSEIFFLNLILLIFKNELCSIFFFLAQGPMDYVLSTTIAGVIPLTMTYFHWPFRKSDESCYDENSNSFMTNISSFLPVQFIDTDSLSD